MTSREELAALVRIGNAAALEADLRAELARPSSDRAVTVTELVDPRTGYFRRRTAVAPDAERESIRRRGRRWHELVGPLIAAPEHCEVRLRRDNIVGQLDGLTDWVIEIKSTERTPDLGRLVEDRPGYVLQLALYCALATRTRGRLVLLQPPGPERDAGVVVADLTFDSLDALWAAAQERAEMLRTAERSGSAGALPRCAWRGRGCEYELANVCDCTGLEPPDPLPALALPVRTERNLGEASRLAAALLAAERAPIGDRFRTLTEPLYPRRAFFDRQRGTTESGVRARPGGDPRDAKLYREILTSLEGERIGGEQQLVRDVTGAGRLLCIEGDPVLLKLYRSDRPTPAEQIARRQIHYRAELAVRAVALDRGHAWLVVGFPRLPPSSPPAQVLGAEIDLVAARAWLSSRSRELADALEQDDPRRVEACPTWMYDDCPYRVDCGCGAVATAPRS